MKLEEYLIADFEHQIEIEKERIRKITKHRRYKAKAILSIIKISKKWKRKNVQNAGKKSPQARFTKAQQVKTDYKVIAGSVRVITNPHQGKSRKQGGHCESR